MNNNTSLLILFLFITSIINAQTIVSTSPENKKAVVEKFTGINCNYCPCGDVIINNAISSNPENVIVVKVHEGGYATPGAGQPDFRTAYGDALSAQAANTGNPAVTVNRHFFPSYASNGGTAIGGCYSNASGVALQSPPSYAIDEILLEPAYVNVAANATIDYTTSTLTVNTEIYYTGDSPISTNFLQIALLQDNTIAYQAGSSLAAGGTDYEHDSRLVDFITGQWGEAINSTTTGSFVERTHTYTIPSDYNGVPAVLDDLKVVVYVSESQQEVINGNRANMQIIYGVPYNLSVDSIDGPESPAILTDSESVTATVSNVGDNDVTNFQMTLEVDGVVVATEDFTGTLASGESTQFTFATTYDFSEGGDYNVTVSVNFEQDEDLSNNSVSQVVTCVASGDCPDEYELPIVWRENFECYDPFAIDNIEGWTIIDNDGGTTWGANGVDFTNESYVGAGIIFNYPLATPVGGDASVWNTYEGNQGLYFFASGANATTIPNDDWMISPEFSMDGVTTPILSFWAKSLTDQYGLERFQIGVGTTTNPSDFTIITPGSYVEPPTQWTQYQYDLSAYEGQNIRLAIHYMGNDSFVLMMDNFVIEGTLGITNYSSLEMSLYPNPVDQNYVTIETPISGSKEIEVFDLLGKKVIDVNSSSNQLDISQLNSGVYMVRVTVGNQSSTTKLIVE